MLVWQSSWGRCSLGGKKGGGTYTRFAMQSCSLHIGDVIQIYYMRNPTSSDSFWRQRRAVDGDRHSIALQSSAMYRTNYARLWHVVANVAMEEWRCSGICSVFVFYVAACSTDIHRKQNGQIPEQKYRRKGWDERVTGCQIYGGDWSTV